MMQISFCGMVRLMKMHTWIRGTVYRWGVLVHQKGLISTIYQCLNKTKEREGKEREHSFVCARR